MSQLGKWAEMLIMEFCTFVFSFNLLNANFVLVCLDVALQGL